MDVPEALEAPDVPCVDLVEGRVALVRDRAAVRDPVRVRQCGELARREGRRRVRALLSLLLPPQPAARTIAATAGSAASAIGRSRFIVQGSFRIRVRVAGSGRKGLDRRVVDAEQNVDVGARRVSTDRSRAPVARRASVSSAVCRSSGPLARHPRLDRHRSGRRSSCRRPGRRRSRSSQSPSRWGHRRADRISSCCSEPASSRAGRASLSRAASP